MDTEREIQWLKDRIQKLEEQNKQLDGGLQWIIDSLRKKGILPKS